MEARRAALRPKLDLFQRSVAAKGAGVSWRTISHLLNERKRTRASDVEKLERWLEKVKRTVL